MKTVVQVQRLQEISKEDAVAEGICFSEALQGFHAEEGRRFHGASAVRSFEFLWSQINGSESWLLTFGSGR